MSASGRRRVVITGLGAVTPLGNDVRSSWENLVAGRTAAGPITAFDTNGFAVTFACEAKDFDRRSGSSASRRGVWTGSRR
jgi:3-oxoacyl-(acyl-carrier-protein) synthase